MAINRNKKEENTGADMESVENFIECLNDVSWYECKEGKSSASGWRVTHFVRFNISGMWVTGFKIMSDGKSDFLAFPSEWNADKKEAYPTSWLDSSYSKDTKKAIADKMLEVAKEVCGKKN